MGEATTFRVDPSRNPILANLPLQAQNQLLGHAQRVHFGANEIIIREGDPSEFLIFVSSGEVAILKGDIEIDRQQAGGILGEMGVLIEQRRTATVKSISEVEAWKVSAKDFLNTMDGYPMALRGMIRELIKKFEATAGVRVNQFTQTQRATDLLSRCVSKEVLDNILQTQTPEQLLEGSHQRAAILFFDIRGFSSMAERMNAGELLRALNEHLDVIIDSVAKHGGIIVNFIGDAVLAVFNTPLPIPQPAVSALNCYLDCRSQLRALHEQRRKTGQVCFDLGAGLNFGSVVAGAIGSADRFSYTILGDEVNLAARLESLTRHYPVEMIFSEACYAILTPELQEACLCFDRVQVKGRQHPVSLYTLDDGCAKDRQAFREAVQTYLAGDFEKALKSFVSLSSKLAARMAERCAEMMHRSSATAWPGYYTWIDK
jgi:class 3 adenylate cyclase